MFVLFKILFGCALIYILYINGGINPAIIDFSLKSILIYFFATILITLTIFLSAVRLYMVFVLFKISIPFNYIFKINYIGNFFNQCLPGAQGGDIIKIIYLIKKYQSLNKLILISCIIIDRLFGLIALSILFLFSLYFLSDTNNNLLNLFYLFFSIIIILFLLIFIFIYFDLISILNNKIKSSDNYFLKLFSEYFKNIKKIKNFHFLNTLKLIFISLLIFIIAFFAILLLIGLELNIISNIMKIFFMSSVAFFSNAIPISFNGLGVGEYVFSQLSNIFYNDKAVLFGNVFLIYRILIILCSLPGLLIFISFKNKI